MGVKPGDIDGDVQRMQRYNVVDRDLESNREVEHFVEPHTPAFCRPSHHTTDQRASKCNMAPTNRTKSDREEAIQRALAKRERENTPFDDHALEFGIPKTTLYNRFWGMSSRRKAHENHQALTPGMEDALLQWASELDSRGSPPRLDLFKATAAELASQQAGSSLPVNLGPTWIRGFLGRHLEFRMKSAVLQDYQRLHASHPTPIRNYFNKLGAVLRKYNIQPHNMYNVDEKGFQLGVHNRAKVIVRHRCRPPIEKMDGSREWITVVEFTCADNPMLPPMVIYKGKGLYRGWFTEIDDQNAKFAHSTQGYMADNLAIEWL